jgi:dTDP-4-amino-4,6-dideoxygalactose transaminase
MAVTTRSDLAELMRTLRDHGASKSDLSRHQGNAAFLLSEYRHLGYNYRMTDIQGALGCAQMTRAADILAARSRLASSYDTRLADLGWLKRPLQPKGLLHAFQAYVCLFQPDSPTLANAERLHEQRNSVMARLEEQGISTRQGTHAPILLEYYRQKYALRPEAFPNAYLADRLTLALPLYCQMTEDEQSQVVDALTFAFDLV